MWPLNGWMDGLNPTNRRGRSQLGSKYKYKWMNLFIIYIYFIGATDHIGVCASRLAIEIGPIFPLVNISSYNKNH